MRTPICDMLGCEFPVLAFSHCRDVVAAVSKAGGFGVLGAVMFTEEELEIELAWIDKEVGDRAYGVDVLIPEKPAPGSAATIDDFKRLINDEHWAFVRHLLDKYDVPPLAEGDHKDHALTLGPPVSQALALVEVSLSHPKVKLVASALGPPPPEMVKAAHDQGVVVASLVGAKKHAVKQKDAGVDIVVAQGYEAGGHTGKVATMVLTPEVVDAVAPIPVLAAGGIASGRQIAAALALGAQGVWTGSVWLQTQEAEVLPVIQQKFSRATSSDTVQSRSTTGKPARQLRSAWTDEWEAPGAPDPLPMPLQTLLFQEAKERIERSAHVPGSGAEQLVNYYVGQVVGMLEAVRPARQVLMEMVEEYVEVAMRFADQLAASET